MKGGGGWRGGTEFSLVPIFAMCSKENLRAFFFKLAQKKEELKGKQYFFKQREKKLHKLNKYFH